jgi:hypothetical protein
MEPGKSRTDYEKQNYEKQNYEGLFEDDLRSDANLLF